MIRVLVVEDSSTARELLVGILATQPQDFTVIGEATNGAEGVEMTRRLRPDVVTMDIRMPLLDGLEATRQIMANTPTPVVVVSSIGNLDVENSMEALRAGALAVIEKPAGPATAGFEDRCRTLLQTIKLMARVKVVRHYGGRPVAHPAAPLLRGRDVPDGRVRAVAIATSTGGPAALQTIFSQLPRDFPVPILIVQHIATGFVSGLASWLSASGKTRVKVAEANEPLAPGTAYLAPDDLQLGLTSHGRIVVAPEPKIGGFRPSASFLFDSAAQALGRGALAVMLTGMGRDGVEGLRRLKASGGRIVVQDEGSSVVFGMPGAAIEAGLADEVVALDDIAGRLMALVTG
ncbi:MAG: chemotaxis-specific protein-glutamate methyltransferase CheB [Myxococcales bacterium]